ncbi:hypothetical protein GCM10010317_077610 [Streptomyces mirabilis]|uniref:hypothetical protein n=1 Tax=Streptomyces mirabilis TaxID=68239 RepID=UPI00167DC56E|nr:hypothetical protein [Streptomyces mirabilis]GHD70386.1 hypothetical protein GCM10010317_077610 [Streptomyces mirabilis]
MTALLLFDAIDAAAAIWQALLAWIVAAAFVATVCLFAGIAVIAQGVKTARRALSRRCGAPEAPDGAPDVHDAPEAPQGRTAHPAPSWARGDHNHQEAA